MLYKGQLFLLWEQWERLWQGPALDEGTGVAFTLVPLRLARKYSANVSGPLMSPTKGQWLSIKDF